MHQHTQQNDNTAQDASPLTNVFTFTAAELGVVKDGDAERTYSFTEVELQGSLSGYKVKNSGALNKLRAAWRMTLFTGLALSALVLTPVQALVVGPLGNRTTIPRLINRASSWIFNIKMDVSGAPMHKDNPTWFIANHSSTADVWKGKVLPSVFLMKSDILKWPVAGMIAKAARFIGVHRGQAVRDVVNDGNSQKTPEQIAKDREYAEYKLKQNIGLIRSTFNRGDNITSYQEGTTTDGKRVLRMSAGLLASLFEEASGIDKKGNEVNLTADVYVQGIGVKVKSVNGQDVSDKPEEWEAWTMHNDDGLLTRLWKRAQIRELTLDLHFFPAQRAIDSDNHFDLTNFVHAQISRHVVPEADPEQAQKPGDYVRDGRALRNAAQLYKKMPRI